MNTRPMMLPVRRRATPDAVESLLMDILGEQLDPVDLLERVKSKAPDATYAVLCAMVEDEEDSPELVRVNGDYYLKHDMDELRAYCRSVLEDVG